MCSLRGGFEQYREQHEVLVREEMSVLREEMEMKEALRVNGLDCSTYESEIEGVGQYVGQMQQYLNSKMQLLQRMQQQLSQLQHQNTNAKQLTASLRSTPEPQQWHHADEQLLEGLSGDEHIAKLF